MAEEKPETHVEVVVVTTGGSYPVTGTDRVAAHQPVRNQLAKAAKALHIVDTTGWIARVGGTELDVDKSYIDNHLTGTVKLDYGPREGGGGDE
jgi:hypothetical protein